MDELDLRHPEDILYSQGDYALVGLFLRVERIYSGFSKAVTDMTVNAWREDGGVSAWVSAVVARESRLERWLDNALCYLPDWYFADKEE